MNLNNWINILPINDIEDHEESNNCKCSPTVDIENELIIHNAFDGRDIIEKIERGESEL